MTNSAATAATLIRQAAEAATPDEFQGVTFDARSVDRVFKFANSPDRLNMAVNAAQSVLIDLIMSRRSNEPSSSEWNLRIAYAAHAAVRLGEQLGRPRGRLYRDGPDGFIAMEV